MATLAQHHAGVLEELEDKPMMPAAEAIKEARSELRCAQFVRSSEIPPQPKRRKPPWLPQWAILGSNQ